MAALRRATDQQEKEGGVAQRLQRGIIIVPSALTLANLFFGIWAMVEAARGHFATAAWLIVAAGLADMLDGRVARYTRTGSRFGEELDSLVDAISFGVAPAFVMYHLFLSTSLWGWIAAYIYVTAAVIRLARFNIEQGGSAKVAFHGLPSPSAGMLLATFYPFSQTDFFATHLGGLPWSDIMIGAMVVLGGLMMSHVLYPVVPKFGFRNARGIATLALIVASVIAAFTIPELYFFPMLFLYVSYGMLKTLVLGLFEQLPDRDPLLDVDLEEGGDEAGAEIREIAYEDMEPADHQRSRQPTTDSEERA